MNRLASTLGTELGGWNWRLISYPATIDGNHGGAALALLACPTLHHLKMDSQNVGTCKTNQQ